MNKRKSITRKAVLTAALALVITIFAVGIPASANEYTEGEISEPVAEGPAPAQDESSVEASNDKEIISTEGREVEENIFEDIYQRLELNADKIFSVMAFIGTLIVSLGYKNGLLPLLKDALSKLKGAIDNVKENGEKNNATTAGKIDVISEKIKSIEENVYLIESQVRGYDLLCKERESMRVILSNQVDMLYAIFMSSALPQYQKDEVGEKIQEMREELKSYEEQAE